MKNLPSSRRPPRAPDAWDRLLNEALTALGQRRFGPAIDLLRQVADADSRKALKWPRFRQALGTLAFVLYQNGQPGEALACQTRLLGLYPGDGEARDNFLHLLQAAENDLPDSHEFRGLLQRILAQTDAGLYAVPAARAFLKDQDVREAAARLLGSGDEAAVAALRRGRFRPIMQSPLLLWLMRETLPPLPEIEALFGKLRRTLLLAYVRFPLPGHVRRADRIENEFMGALAHYVWLTEYAIPADEDEAAAARDLRRGIETALASGGGPPPADLACLALYQSWLDLPDGENLLAGPMAHWKPWWQPLLRDWRDCLEERRRRADIPSLTAIRDGVSSAVREQYEANPFPRWRHNPVAQRRQTAAAWLAGQAPGVKLPERFGGPLDVLVAGCGTGLEPISLVRQIETGRVLAVDLSRASLAYALRMAEALDLAGAIDFRQADILNLAGLPDRFDLVTASGVLHHLEDPLAGWRVLADLLRPGGMMLVSLYSEAARRPVARAREIIAAEGWEATPERMRHLRRAILAGQYEELKPLGLWRDFYNLSMFRDLAFHVQEHRYSLPQIQAHIAGLGLRFLGMRGLPGPARGLYQSMFADDPMGIDLSKWAAFEALHPGAFAGMYGLMLQKPVAHG